MQITLPPELERYARRQVAQGQFKSLSAVVSAALETVRRQNGSKARAKKGPATSDSLGNAISSNGQNGTRGKSSDSLQSLLDEGVRDVRKGRVVIYDEAGKNSLAARVIRDGRTRLKKRNTDQ